MSRVATYRWYNRLRQKEEHLLEQQRNPINLNRDNYNEEVTAFRREAYLYNRCRSSFRFRFTSPTPPIFRSSLIPPEQENNNNLANNLRAILQNIISTNNMPNVFGGNIRRRRDYRRVRLPSRSIQDVYHRHPLHLRSGRERWLQNFVDSTFDNHEHENGDKNQFESTNQTIFNKLQEQYDPRLKNVGYVGPKEPPEDIICPLTSQIYDEPVQPKQKKYKSHNFEKSAIKKWLKKNKTNPLNRQPLNENDLIDNKTLKQKSNNFIKQAIDTRHHANIKYCANNLHTQQNPLLTDNTKPHPYHPLAIVPYNEAKEEIKLQNGLSNQYQNYKLMSSGPYSSKAFNEFLDGNNYMGARNKLIDPKTRKEMKKPTWNNPTINQNEFPALSKKVNDYKLLVANIKKLADSMDLKKLSDNQMIIIRNVLLGIKDDSELENDNVQSSIKCFNANFKTIKNDIKKDYTDKIKLLIQYKAPLNTNNFIDYYKNLIKESWVSWAGGTFGSKEKGQIQEKEVLDNANKNIKSITAKALQRMNYSYKLPTHKKFNKMEFIRKYQKQKPGSFISSGHFGKSIGKYKHAITEKNVIKHAMEHSQSATAKTLQNMGYEFRPA